ncbi:unnamed protein product [Brassicogethes aeneus]|uniref:Uncharacterized protein n=1 Tax=Brassicogethes aeneus TaxID=1431903 RepID=A0A9P0F9F9_BRAAE|nr:unnamed protein product [Brassicogethes aeneus]
MSLPNISSMENFDCEGDVSSVASCWEKWKRAFNIGKKCAFQNLEDNLIDQVVEKGSYLKLKKIGMGDSMTLETIVSKANSLEALERQPRVCPRGSLITT